MATGGKGIMFEEFIVDTKQVSEITRAKSKIQRMHEVKIVLKEVAKKESKQWIRVVGEMRDRMNARVWFIQTKLLSLCLSRKGLLIPQFKTGLQVF